MCSSDLKYGKDLLITFGFQDNAAFVLRTPEEIVNDLLKEALDYGSR